MNPWQRAYSVQLIHGRRYLIPRGTLLGTLVKSRFEKVARRVFRYAMRETLRDFYTAQAEN